MGLRTMGGGLGLALLLGLGTTVGSARVPACGRSFALVASANPSGDSRLSAVDVRSPSLAWVAGRLFVPAGPRRAVPFLERWNGSSWTPVATPLPSGASSGELYGVAIASRTSVWGVGGAHFPATNSSSALIEHWTPAGVSALSGQRPQTYLEDVVSLSSRNAWAVGGASAPGVGRVLVEHWNGKKWTTVSAPTPTSTRADLWSVDALTPSNIWASGGTTANGVERTLVEHWNGKRWVVVPSPNGSRSNSFLGSVDATSRANAWAVGSTSTGNQSSTLVERWDGRSWKIVPSPSPAGAALNGVAAVSSRSAFAVGYAGSPVNVFALHWNGSSWQVASTPRQSWLDSELDGVAALRSGLVWAVGSADVSNTTAATVVFRRCG